MDDVRVFSGSERISTIDQISAAAAVAVAMRVLLRAASDRALARYVASGLEDRVLLRLTSAKDEGSPKELQRDFVALQESADSAGRIFISVAYSILDELRDVYPIIVEVPVPDMRTGIGAETRLMLQRRVIPQIHLGDSNKAQATLERLRVMAGTTPSAIAIGVSEAERARSYHLQVQGPAGTYLARQRFIDRHKSRETLQVPGSDRVMRRRNGQRYAHLYLRNVSFPKSVDPYFVAYFYERSPGSLAVPTISAAAAAAMVAIAAYIALGYGNGSGSDVVAVLLSVPALIGAWLGADSQVRIAGPRVGSRVANFITVVCSIAAVGLYLARPDEQTFLKWNAASLALTERPGFSSWLVLAAVLVTDLIACLGALALGAALHSYFVTRDDGVTTRRPAT